MVASHHRDRSTLWHLALVGTVVVAHSTSALSTPLMDKARELSRRGDWPAAAETYDRVANTAEVDLPTRARAWLGLAAACQAMGRFQLAQAAATEAQKAAAASRDRRLTTAALAERGLLDGRLGRATAAAGELDQAVKLARELEDCELEAVALEHRGQLHAIQLEYADAASKFASAAAVAARCGAVETQTRAMMNQALLAVRGDGKDEALQIARQCESLIAGMPASTHRVAVLLAVARVRQLGGEVDGARQAYGEARSQAQALGDIRSLSFALGGLGGLARERGRLDEALAFARQALLAAQELQSPHLLYRWEWLLARVLRETGRTDSALAAYRRAVEALEPICQDLAASLHAVMGGSFRQSVGQVYYELADLLLQRAAATDDAEAKQRDLREARDTVERLKVGELQDYFGDECLEAARAKEQDIQAVLGDAASVYYIPLADRTEILLGLSDGLHQFTSSMAADEVGAKARRLRHHLQLRNSRRYLRYAQQLYEALIRPIDAALQQADVHTLIFVPDGALRTVPMAALHDGQRFLIQRYAVAVTPGITLMDPHPIQREGAEVLAGGISESVQGYDALPNVRDELRMVAEQSAAKELLDKSFRRQSVQDEFRLGQYSIVHIASHGEFQADASQNFVLTYDGRLTLNALEQLIRPRRARGKPVELLVLSACQTAEGDDRAALGLAGVAVKAGARAALATLWSVSDEATAQLFREFYRLLGTDSSISKAKALQQAQCKLIADEKFQHPAFWAPYLLVGNWL